MATKQLENGKWFTRARIPTGRRDEGGRIIYRDTTKTTDTKSAGELWAKNEKAKFRETGASGTLTLSEIAEYTEAKKLVRENDLRLIAKEWLQRNPEQDDLTIKEVIEKYRSSVEWSRFTPETSNTKESQLNRFKAKFGSIRTRSVQIEDIEDYLDVYTNPVTWNSHARTIKTFFQWTLGRGHRYLTHSPVEALTLRPEDFGNPKYLTLEEVKNLFDQAVKNDSGLIPFLALGFFAGIRTSEIKKLEARDFLMDDRQINIRADVAKRKRAGKPLPRLLDGLPDTLWKWLEAVDFKGSIDCTNLVPRRKSLYTDAGIQYWPNSAARHTFATYAYAKLQSSQIVKKWTGHRGDDSILLTHYAGLEAQSRGRQYFEEIIPASTIKEHRKKTSFENRGNWPSDEKLLKMAENTSKTEIAKTVGVSEAAVRNRLKKISANKIV